jgi:hypothetical protein
MAWRASAREQNALDGKERRSDFLSERLKAYFFIARKAKLGSYVKRRSVKGFF